MDHNAHTQSQEVLVQVEGVSKKFCRHLKKSLWYGIQDMAAELLPIRRWRSLEAKSGDGLRAGEFWVNRDICFELRRGECLGLIGRNGAGKTTLLKMLNGLIKPDAGSITMRGRVGALIALGAGFNPILTGRENIYVNGSILGLAKEEIDRKMRGIIEFAEIGEFIDSAVQSYSSGMQVRLGFAVATALDPDILILDEVLAVGDAAFRAKCYRRILEMRKKAAVIFVTHSMEQISRICDYTLVLNGGRILFSGDVNGGIRAYGAVNELGKAADPSFLALNGHAKAFSISAFPGEVVNGGELEVRMKLTMDQDCADYWLRITIYGPSGSVVAEVNEGTEKFGLVLRKGEHEYSIYIPFVPLRVGKYELGINLIDKDGDISVWSYKEHALVISGEYMGGNSECQVAVSRWHAVCEATAA